MNVIIINNNKYLIINIKYINNDNNINILIIINIKYIL